MTRNFSRAEFACKCGCGFDSIAPTLVDGLQALRDKLGRAIIVTSGCRCKDHNKRVGGAAKSRHVTGEAADIKVLGVSARLLYKYAADILVFSGVGVSDEGGFIHVDVRPGIVRTKWCYKNGREVAWFDV